MSTQLFLTFLDHAQDVMDYDKPQAITLIHNALCCRDVPNHFKQDARSIMEKLLLECFKA